MTGYFEEVVESSTTTSTELLELIKTVEAKRLSADTFEELNSPTIEAPTPDI